MKALVLAAAALLYTSGWSFGQEPAFVSHFPPRTSADILRSKGIDDLSLQSLIAELKNSDPEIRREAANELAAERKHEAIPAIESALSREGDLAVQIGLAEAAVLLNDPVGRAHLWKMCSNPTLDIGTLIAATRALQLAKSASVSCADTLLEAMSSSKEDGNIAIAASLLSDMHTGATREQSLRIVSVLRRFILDPARETSLRINASRALGQIDAAGASQALQAALSRETELAVRSSLPTSFESWRSSNTESAGSPRLPISVGGSSTDELTPR